MAYSRFTLTRVEQDFGLTIGAADLFPAVPPVPPAPETARLLTRNLELAAAQGTEKASSELLIAPLLADLWELSGRLLAVYSGVELSVDPARELDGVCDFLITPAPQVVPVRAPVMAVVESKRYEVSSGYAQCAAEMVAALELNRREATGRTTVYGAATNGGEWQFLRLAGTRLDIDTRIHPISDPARILGILLAVCGFGPSPLHPRPDAS